MTRHRGSLSRNATSRTRLPAGPDPTELAGFFTSVAVSAKAMTQNRPNFPVRAPRLADRLEGWGAAFFFGVFKLLPLDCTSAVGGGLARRIGPFSAFPDMRGAISAAPFPSFPNLRSR